MTPFGRHRETRFCHEKRLSKRISPRSGTPAQTRGARVFTPGLPLRVVRRFQTTHPTYKWLNRLQCLNISEADLERFEVRYTCTLSGSLQGFPCQHTKPARTVSPEMAKRRGMCQPAGQTRLYQGFGVKLQTELGMPGRGATEWGIQKGSPWKSPADSLPSTGSSAARSKK
jgi:hypothetical protein